MKVLDKDEKKIYEGLKITFKSIDCWDIPVPEGWKNIKVAKFDDDTWDVKVVIWLQSQLVAQENIVGVENSAVTAIIWDFIPVKKLNMTSWMYIKKA